MDIYGHMHMCTFSVPSSCLRSSQTKNHNLARGFSKTVGTCVCVCVRVLWVGLMCVCMPWNVLCMYMLSCVRVLCMYGLSFVQFGFCNLCMCGWLDVHGWMSLGVRCLEICVAVNVCGKDSSHKTWKVCYLRVGRVCICLCSWFLQSLRV